MYKKILLVFKRTSGHEAGTIKLVDIATYNQHSNGNTHEKIVSFLRETN